MMYTFKNGLGNSYEVDTAHDILRQDGAVVTEVKPKMFDLLTYLLEHREDAVTKGELLEHVWPGETVSESSLYSSINKLRQAFHDQRREQVIKVFHRRGYQFVAPVTVRYIGLEGLRAVAGFSSRIWTLPADQVPRAPALTRDLWEGGPQPSTPCSHRLGSRILVAFELDRASYLLLVDEGTTGNLYCLCPSWFAPQMRFQAGRWLLPQADSPEQAFMVTGSPGRESLFAVITDDALALDWLPREPQCPPRALTQPDIDALLACLHGLEKHRWRVWSTSFEVIA